MIIFREAFFFSQEKPVRIFSFCPLCLSKTSSETRLHIENEKMSVLLWFVHKVKLLITINYHF